MTLLAFHPTSANQSEALTQGRIAPASLPHQSATGAPDPIQLHAEAHNALSMAVFYLRQPAANVPGARRKAVQALAALRGLGFVQSVGLEG